MLTEHIQKTVDSSPLPAWQGVQAIILAGGLGTRLRETVPDLPKCLAPVAGRPFLFYLINYLRSEGVNSFIFSIGYKQELITDYLKENFSTLDYTCVIEEEPLGTGGAIRHALVHASEEHVLVVNGDTLFKVNLNELLSFHHSGKADCTLSLKPMHDFNRYGTVEINNDNSVSGFKEKQFLKSGLINGGVYLIKKTKFAAEIFPEIFSFEKDYLEKYFKLRKMFALVQDNYFIDIGIPEDYNRVQSELLQPSLDLKTIDKSWTLFIDRDGVINHEKKEDYIRNLQEFRFYDGVKEAIKLFASRFGKIIIVSNQRGVERGLMSENDLIVIHNYLQKEIEDADGRIDRIYYCTSIDNKHPDRKPNPGMAFKARKDFPSIDFSKSIMVGNKQSDMQFGKQAGLYTVYVKTTHPEQEFPHLNIDLIFDSLSEFAKAL